ncbi:Slp family lipoprotein [Pantoea sp. A4]|uniref:Slp family lipoprotein n=1 Tax=Pantoea sp. A4 TaxID=1225184 RepID=UPI00037EE8B0|nr:Slp family lipoprotein [Pantoea sp. A4]
MPINRKGISGVLLSCALLLSGCASVPDSIKGSSALPQQDITRVLNAPKLYVGQEARFGGKVVQVTNRNGVTRLEIATQPLDEGARPILGSASKGRIYADVHSFVDPVDVANQYVTVLGTIRGTEKGVVGQASYDFVVVDVRGYQRWRMQRQVVSSAAPMDNWVWYGPTRHRGGYWGPPPFWAFPPAPAQVDTILTE